MSKRIQAYFGVGDGVGLGVGLMYFSKQYFDNFQQF